MVVVYILDIHLYPTQEVFSRSIPMFRGDLRSLRLGSEYSRPVVWSGLSEEPTPTPPPLLFFFLSLPKWLNEFVMASSPCLAPCRSRSPTRYFLSEPQEALHRLYLPPSSFPDVNVLCHMDGGGFVFKTNKSW